ncbi:hypothetical protein [Streptomyces wuyuanensis]|uniref:hypothetical protein n=1 Tax=Streptomyces wuyuanensis TaxID=1196353 RepID=UPI0034204934
MPDYFDRLLARHTAPAAPRVRPRLPGPFERVEALRTAPPEAGEPAPLVPVAPMPPAGPAGPVRHERETRTERHTVVRTGPDRPRVPEPPAAGPAGRPEPPRTAPATAPGQRPAPEAGLRAGRRGTPPAADGEPRRAPGSAEARATAPAPRPAALVPARPRRADTPAGVRGTAQGGLGRRAPRPAERVVHVQIGRLEVSAAPAPGAGRPAPRSGRTERPGPALTLADYLARGEKRD